MKTTGTVLERPSDGAARRPLPGRSFRRLVLSLAAGTACAAGTLPAQTYTSPYAITLGGSIPAWTSDFDARRQAVVSNSTPAPADWYSHDYGTSSYGPLNPQLFSSSAAADPSAVAALRYDRGHAVFDVAINTPPEGVSPDTWARQRLLFAASRLIGTHYQHLHLPGFDPALVTGSTFPWSPVSGNSLLQTTQDLRNGQPGTVANPYKSAYNSPHPGIDCTDFSAYLYNLALGVQMHSGTSTQVTFGTDSGPTTTNQPSSLVLDSAGSLLAPVFHTGPNYGTAIPNAAGSLDGVIARLHPGDLLYMTGGDGRISHVVVWLGEYGTLADGSPSAVPLVISSHDNTPAIFDTAAIDPITGLPLDGMVDAHLPPPGVHILPFTPETWFYQNFSLAMNIVPEPSAVALCLLGLAALLVIGRRRKTDA